MNTLLRRSWISFYLILAVLISCKPDEPSAKEIFISKISKKWGLSESGVKFNDQFVNGVFDNFTVTFAKGLTYTTTDGQDPVWKASGKFTIQKVENPVGFLITRDDGVEITVNELTESKLVLQFAFTKKTGRAKSVSGGYVFDLIPQ